MTHVYVFVHHVCLFEYLKKLSQRQKRNGRDKKLGRLKYIFTNERTNQGRTLRRSSQLTYFHVRVLRSITNPLSPRRLRRWAPVIEPGNTSTQRITFQANTYVHTYVHASAESRTIRLTWCSIIDDHRRDCKTLEATAFCNHGKKTAPAKHWLVCRVILSTLFLLNLNRKSRKPINQRFNCSSCCSGLLTSDHLSSLVIMYLFSLNEHVMLHCTIVSKWSHTTRCPA